MTFIEIVGKYQFDGNLHEFYNSQKDNLTSVFMSYLTSVESDEDFARASTIIQDLLIHSNLLPRQKREYEDRLSQDLFFEKYSNFLTHEKLSFKSTAILLIGKFSIPSNAEYLEKVFINFYYNKNPILAARVLSELAWLKSLKYEEYVDVVKGEKSEMNMMTLGLLYSSSPESHQLYKRLKREYTALQKIRDLHNYFLEYERMVFGIHRENQLSDWNKENYYKSFSYFKDSYINKTELQKNNFLQIYQEYVLSNQDIS